IDSLKDKASTVRKNAIVLIVRLIVTHPYGLMHGGLLGLKEWQERYQAVSEELKVMEDKIGKAVERDDAEDAEDAEGVKKEEEEDSDEDDGDEEEETEDGEEGLGK